MAAARQWRFSGRAHLTRASSRERMLAALGVALFIVLAACSTRGDASPADDTPASSADDPVILRIRPVVQGPEQPAGSGSATGTTSGNAAGSAGPVTQEQAAASYVLLTCGPGDTAAPDDTATDYIAECDQEGSARYLLAPAIIEGTDVTHARAGRQATTGEWAVLVTFNSRATAAWADYTASNIGTSVAITVNGRVLSAPTIQSAINGRTTITGNFTEASARRLAQQLGGG